jgi:hypothetical protein
MNSVFLPRFAGLAIVAVELPGRLSMKTIIKLLIAAVILNATIRLGMSALTQYQFRDAVQEAVLFGAQETTGELQAVILKEAEELGVPLEAGDVDVERQGMLTTHDLDVQGRRSTHRGPVAQGLQRLAVQLAARSAAGS